MTVVLGPLDSLVWPELVTPGSVADILGRVELIPLLSSVTHLRVIRKGCNRCSVVDVVYYMYLSECNIV